MREGTDIAVSIATGTLLGMVFGIAGAIVLVKPLEKFIDKYEDSAYQKVWNGGVQVVEGIAEIIEEAIDNG